MALTDPFLLESAIFGISVAARSDNQLGEGTTDNPYNASTRKGPAIAITLGYESASPREALVHTHPIRHDLLNGDMVLIAGVTGDEGPIWNGTFGIYDVSEFAFKYFMKKPIPPDRPPPGNPTFSRLSFPLDELLGARVPERCLIRIGPGLFQTRGFAPGEGRGFQARSGWKILGSGMEATVLQLVGASKADEHYHIIGMPIEATGTTPIPPLQGFEISNLTLDANADHQPGRPDPGYANVACGAVRILGSQCRVTRVKVVNFGTKSFKQGCFVISITGASAQPSNISGLPIMTETVHNGIENCIAIQPSQSNAREVTVLHLGGLKNSENQAQGFARGPFVRRNFVDCAFRTTEDLPKPYPSAFITARAGVSPHY